MANEHFEMLANTQPIPVEILRPIIIIVHIIM